MIIQQQFKLDDSLTISDATRLLNANRIGYYRWLRKKGPYPDVIRFEMEIKIQVLSTGKYNSVEIE